LPHLLGTNENELRRFYYNEESVPGVSLAVMWIRGEKKVKSFLNHFSRYAMGTERAGLIEIFKPLMISYKMATIYGH